MTEFDAVMMAFLLKLSQPLAAISFDLAAPFPGDPSEPLPAPRKWHHLWCFDVVFTWAEDG
jgi:hypothetical protein